MLTTSPFRLRPSSVSVGIAAGLILAAALGILVLAGVRSHDPTTRRFAWASLFALVYLLGHQMFDFYPNMPAVGFFLALSVGQLDALVQPTVGLFSGGRSAGSLRVVSSSPLPSAWSFRRRG